MDLYYRRMAHVTDLVWTRWDHKWDGFTFLQTSWNVVGEGEFSESLV